MARIPLGWKALRYFTARLQKKARLSAIHLSEIDRTSVVEGGSQVVDATMGRHSFCGYDCIIINADIGRFCSIADNVYIGGSAHPIEFVSTSPVFLSHRDSVKTKFSMHDYYYLPRTSIGHDVWIGYGARLRAGIKVGHGSVIGMGAIVTRDVEPYTIVGGNPAGKIRDRFPKEIADGLLKSEWWNYSDDELRKSSPYFQDPVEFLKFKGLI